MRISIDLRAIFGVAAFLYCALTTAGCTRLRVQSTSPNGKHTIVISEKEYLVDSRVKVTLILDQGRTEVLYSHPSDWILGFSHIWWSDDSSLVGVLACNLGGRDLVLGYDIAAKKEVELQHVRRNLSNIISKRYKPPPGSDALHWACSHQLGDLTPDYSIAIKK